MSSALSSPKDWIPRNIRTYHFPSFVTQTNWVLASYMKDLSTVQNAYNEHGYNELTYITKQFLTYGFFSYLFHYKRSRLL